MTTIIIDRSLIERCLKYLPPKSDTLLTLREEVECALEGKEPPKTVGDDS